MQTNMIPFAPPAALVHAVQEGFNPRSVFAPEVETKIRESFEAAGHKGMSAAKMRAIAVLQKVQEAHVQAATRNGLLRDKFRVLESTTPSDIQNFTQQSLAFVRDVFAPFVFADLVTLRPMLGPTAYVHRATLKRDSQSDFYSADSALVDGLDPSYTECPGDCQDSNTIHAEVTGDLLEAECRRLAWEICMPAGQHWSSQYPGSLQALLDGGLQTEIQRAIQADGLSLMVNSAGDTQDYSRTPTAGSYYETANPDEWARVLWKRIAQADRNSLEAAGGRVPLNLVIGDVGGIGILSDLVPLQLAESMTGSPMNEAGVNEMASYFGTVKANGMRVYRVIEGMPADTIIVTRKDDADPTFIHGQWIPFTNLGTLTYPKAAKIEGGAMSLYGQVVIRPDRIQEIRLLD